MQAMQIFLAVQSPYVYVLAPLPNMCLFIHRILKLNEADETGVNVLAINPESHDMLAPGLLPSAEDTVKSDKSEHTLTECVVESQS